MGMQDLLHMIYPPQCLTCDTRVTSDFGLCSTCWRDTPFIHGLVCNLCGAELIGHQTTPEDDAHALCDQCLDLSRPWSWGRAALAYRGKGRQIALAIKHGDRLDLIRPAAGWMLRAAQPMLVPNMLLAPIPLHWTRLFKRRYNQSALLAQAIAKTSGMEVCPDLLIRRIRTKPQLGSLEARLANVLPAIKVHPRRASRIEGRHILLIDDVMTSGATFTAAAEACIAQGAIGISVLALARVAKDA
jgi:predicted amidophosphoribosyltransferase